MKRTIVPGLKHGLKHPAIVAALLALAACGSSSAADDTAPAVARPAALHASPRPLEFVGVVTTRDSKVVAAEFEGRVVELYVHGGQRIRAGDPIVRLDDSQVRQQLAGAIAQVDEARAEIGRASVEVKQSKREARLERRLYRRGAVAREKIRQATFDRSRAHAGLGTVAAQYRKAMSEKRQLEQHLARSILVAPIDGVVSMIRVKEGEVATPGTAVARVFDPRDLWVRFAVDSEYRGMIKEGTRVAAVDPSTGARFDAVVRNVSTDLEPALQFVIADADVDDRLVKGDGIGVGSVGRVLLQPAPRH
jgi:HlyD family secretion protein